MYRKATPADPPAPPSYFKPRVYKCPECIDCTSWFCRAGDYITEWPSWSRAMLRALKNY